MSGRDKLQTTGLMALVALLSSIGSVAVVGWYARGLFADLQVELARNAEWHRLTETRLATCCPPVRPEGGN